MRTPVLAGGRGCAVPICHGSHRLWLAEAARANRGPARPAWSTTCTTARHRRNCRAERNSEVPSTGALERLEQVDGCVEAVGLGASALVRQRHLRRCAWHATCTAHHSRRKPAHGRVNAVPSCQPPCHLAPSPPARPNKQGVAGTHADGRAHTTITQNEAKARAFLGQGKALMGWPSTRAHSIRVRRDGMPTNALVRTRMALGYLARSVPRH